MRNLLEAKIGLLSGSGDRSRTDDHLMITTMAPETAYKSISQSIRMGYCYLYHIVIPELTYQPHLRLNSTRIVNVVSHSMAKYHAILVPAIYVGHGRESRGLLPVEVKPCDISGD